MSESIWEPANPECEEVFKSNLRCLRNALQSRVEGFHGVPIITVFARIIRENGCTSRVPESCVGQLISLDETNPVEPFAVFHNLKVVVFEDENVEPSVETVIRVEDVAQVPVRDMEWTMTEQEVRVNEN